MIFPWIQNSDVAWEKTLIHTVRIFHCDYYSGTNSQRCEKVELWSFKSIITVVNKFEQDNPVYNNFYYILCVKKIYGEYIRKDF